MNNFTKLSLIILAQQLIAVFKNNLTRWLIRTFFTNGELPMSKWYTWTFIQALNPTRITALLIIASFTLLTFPLGLWQSSFNVGLSYPTTRLINALAGLVTFPVNMYLMIHKLKEMSWNTDIKTAVTLTYLSTLLLIVSSYYFYRGYQT